MLSIRVDGLGEALGQGKAVRSAKAMIPLRPTFTSHGVGVGVGVLQLDQLG